ncbi:MAG: hypothetical protein ACPGD8_04070 [Flavobacteriales bacterium]
MTVLLFTGCKPDFTAEVRAVDSLLGVVGQVENDAEEIDARLIRQYIKDVSGKCTKIQAELKDTVELEDAQKLVDFCLLEAHLKTCLERKEMIDAEVVETRNQLYNLRTDLIEKVAEKDSVNRFIESEFQYVESLDEGVERVVAELNGCFETYTELKSDIDRLLIALPAKAAE